MELLFGRLAWTLQCNKTNPKPPGVSVRRMIQVVVCFLVVFDPLVWNQKAELISKY